jgi:hypothetical protein
MRLSLRRIVNALALVPLAACASGGSETMAPRTALETRALQSRSYSASDTRSVMKAVLATLQDDGFLVRAADTELGLITATKEAVRPVSDVARVGRFAFIAVTYGVGALLPGPKSGASIVEATVNVTADAADTRLRVSFQLRVTDGNQRLKQVRPLDDASLYQEFFAKVGKSLFLVKEKVS